MAMYIALRVEAGKVNYNTIFGFRLYKQFQDDVDAILAADGYIVNDDGTVKKAEVVTNEQ